MLLLSGGSDGTGSFAVSDGAYLFSEQGDYSIGGDFVNNGDVSIWDSSSVRKVDISQISTKAACYNFLPRYNCRAFANSSGRSF